MKSTIEARARVRGIMSVRADASKLTDTVAAVQKAFETFKTENDERIAALAKGQEDVVKNEKVDRISADIANLEKEIDAIQKAQAALKLGSGSGDGLTPEAAEHRKAFGQYFRRGAEAGLADLEVKAALTTQSDPDGGYLVPETMESAIDRVLGTVSAMRGLARGMTISTPTYKKLINMGGATSGWVGEEDARPETATPSLREIAIEAMELYANPKATQTMLDDSAVDIEGWLADEVSVEFSEKEGAAFISGDGVKKPRGILAYDTVANASYAWGKIGFLKTGSNAGFDASNPGDVINDLYYALKSGYRQGASWLCADSIMNTIRNFKDGQGNYLYAAPTAEMPATLLGKPIVNDDNMPGIAQNNFPLAFGNFNRAYMIVDRQGVRILRDPYTNKPHVSFYTTKRVGGGVINFEALKLLKISA